jgi:hypothetical protein
MRLSRLIAPVLLGVVLSLISGCTDSTSTKAREWERAAALTRAQRPAYPAGSLAASDGLGRSIFTPDTALDTTVGRSTFANVPTE